MNIPLSAAVIVVVVLAGGLHSSGTRASAEPEFRLAEQPVAIYSSDPTDSWNRIFRFLFSRRFAALMSSEFADGAPFGDFEGPAGSLRGLQVSTRLFERTEVGDRAIDPFYPSFFTDVGARVVLESPGYTEFREALEHAIAEEGQRSTLGRALMQNDLWSAYDILYRNKHYAETGETELAQHRSEILQLLGKLIRKLRLTQEEIRALPENYGAARTQQGLPDLFGKHSGWMEVQWFRRRLHDGAADDRRATRIFVKPMTPPRNAQKFLNDLRPPKSAAMEQLEAAALVTQELVIDMSSRPQPTGITTEVQIRRFRDAQGAELPRTGVEVYEIRRKKIVSDSQSGGMVAEPEDGTTYASSACNDFTFASPLSQRREWAPPVVVKLRTRCMSCHGPDLKGLMTFSMIIPPGRAQLAPVRELDRRAYEAAQEVAAHKMTGESWKALLRQFEAPR